MKPPRRRWGRLRGKTKGGKPQHAVAELMPLAVPGKKTPRRDGAPFGAWVESAADRGPSAIGSQCVGLQNPCRDRDRRGGEKSLAAITGFRDAGNPSAPYRG